MKKVSLLQVERLTAQTEARLGEKYSVTCLREQTDRETFLAREGARFLAVVTPPGGFNPESGTDPAGERSRVGSEEEGGEEHIGFPEDLLYDSKSDAHPQLHRRQMATFIIKRSTPSARQVC